MLVAWSPTFVILIFFIFLAWMQSDVGDATNASDDNDTNGSNSRKASIVGRFVRSSLPFFKSMYCQTANDDWRMYVINTIIHH